MGGAGSGPDKAALRTALLASRAARPADALAQARTTIAGFAIARAGLLPVVAAYVPLQTEPGSLQLLDGLVASGTRVLVPRLLPDRDLAWTDWTVSAGRTDSPQWPPAADALDGPDGPPAAIESAAFVLVPALAVDPQGNRLGRGGGSYDRALGRVGLEIPIVAVLFDEEILDAVPVDPWDRSVTGALTPSGWHSFAGPGCGGSERLGTGLE